MFCYKCGRELPEEAKFCPDCGVKIESGKQGSIEKAVQSGNSWSVTPRSMVLDRMALLKEFKGVFWGTVICLIVSIMIIGGEMFEVTYQMFTEHSVRLTMFDGRESLKTILVLAHLIVIVLMLIPLATGKNYERYNLVPAVIIPIANILIFLIIMMSAKEQINEDLLMEAVRAKAALTGNGWVYLLVNLVTILLSINVKNIVSGTVSENKTDTTGDLAIGETKEDKTQRPYRCAFCDMEGPYEGECPRCGSVSKKYY